MRLSHPRIGGSSRAVRCVANAAASPMTMTEAIIARRANQPFVKPGDNVWVEVDKLMTHDVCGPGTFGIFEKEFGEGAQVNFTLCSLMQE
jgi:homoaconitase/3-isopropylmalate dehydratase large subunit